MIVTVTMNPALDKTARVETLLPGGLNRLESVRVDAGGKGVNASRMVSVLGGETVCTGFIGGQSGRELCGRVEALGIPCDFIEVEGVTRTNMKVMDARGGLTELNEPGISASDRDMDALLEKTAALVDGSGVAVLSGSLPRQASLDTYRRFASALRRAGCAVIVDADGEAFRLALEAPPLVIKPNRFELLQYCGLPQDTPAERLPGLCRALLDKGVEWVVLSMGGEGAMFFTPRQAVWSKALPVKVRSTVGAGDSMVGAIAYALEAGLDFEQTVRLAMAASGGAVAVEGTNPPGLDTVNELKRKVELHPL
ncbi:MAG: 1-phosphofructokinase [Oscillospiraceae bacterium]|jgi:1-phosphofructokinase|nr:1-phosphofructokinase [Oscillospiraceae bacterium]